MALTNTDADCRFLRDRIESLEVKIRILREQIQSNFEILNRGVGNRVRARIEDGIFNQPSSRDEAEILAKANELRQEIRRWQSEISQLEAERVNLIATQRSLGC